MIHRKEAAQFGSGAPTIVTPEFTGQVYYDTLNDDSYISKSKTTGDWILLGAGDMTKSVYDININSIVDKSEVLDDGAGNVVGPLEIRNHLDNLNAHDATEIDTDTTNFNVSLSAADDTVQKALDTLDDNMANVLLNLTATFQPDQSHNYDEYRVHQISASGNSNLTFKIPEDFVSLISIHVHFIPTNTIGAGEFIDIVTNYAGSGELSDTHAESLLNFPISGSAGILESIDIAGAFTNISAEDTCGFNWKNKQIGTSISIITIEVHYNAI